MFDHLQSASPRPSVASRRRHRISTLPPSIDDGNGEKQNVPFAPFVLRLFIAYH
jgi:hypothetical protein